MYFLYLFPSCFYKKIWKCVRMLWLCVAVAQSVLRCTMGLTVWGSNAGGGARISAPVQKCRGSHPASCKMGTGPLAGVKRTGHGVDHPPPSSAEVKETVELYLYSASESSWTVPGWPLPFFTFTYYLCSDYVIIFNYEIVLALLWFVFFFKPPWKRSHKWSKHVTEQCLNNIKLLRCQC